MLDARFDGHAVEAAATGRPAVVVGRGGVGATVILEVVVGATVVEVVLVVVVVAIVFGAVEADFADL